MDNEIQLSLKSFVRNNTKFKTVYQQRDTCFKTSLHLASIFISASLSARVGPILKIKIGFFISEARNTNLYPEYTFKKEKLVNSLSCSTAYTIPQNLSYFIYLFSYNTKKLTVKWYCIFC